MHTMDRAEWLGFVRQGTRTGKVATTRANGAPHVAPVWFLIDSSNGVDQIVFTTAADTVKGKSLRRDPRFAMTVDDQAPPYSFVLLEAEATISENLDETLEWATRLGARYMGTSLAADYGKRNAVPGELLVRGTIRKVVALADIAD